MRYLWKGLFALGCGLGAYYLAVEHSGQNLSVLTYTLSLVGGTIFVNFLFDIFRQVSSPTKQADNESPNPHDLLLSTLGLAFCLAAEHLGQPWLMSIYSHEYQRNGGQTWLALLVWLIAMAILFGGAVGAFSFGSALASNLFALLNLKGGWVNLFSTVITLGCLVLAGWIGYLSMRNGWLIACRDGTYPFGCP